MMATKKELTAQLNALKKRQLTNQLNALKERTAGYQTTVNKNLADITAAKMDAEQPYIEELPAGFEASIPELMASIPKSSPVTPTPVTPTNTSIAVAAFC